MLVDTFSGWTEAYPIRHDAAQIVITKILEEVLPRYGMPALLSSDKGPAFATQVTQGMAKATGMDWKLRCAYRP